MRATDGLQATITVSPVNSDGQAFSLESTLSSSGPGRPGWSPTQAPH